MLLFMPFRAEEFHAKTQLDGEANVLHLSHRPLGQSCGSELVMIAKTLIEIVSALCGCTLFL